MRVDLAWSLDVSVWRTEADDGGVCSEMLAMDEGTPPAEGHRNPRTVNGEELPQVIRQLGVLGGQGIAIRGPALLGRLEKLGDDFPKSFVAVVCQITSPLSATCAVTVRHASLQRLQAAVEQPADGPFATIHRLRDLRHRVAVKVMLDDCLTLIGRERFHCFSQPADSLVGGGSLAG